MADTAQDVELSVCTNCIHLIANGECIECVQQDTHGCEFCDGLASKWGASLAFGGEELGYSTSDCDGCGTWLHGDRFRAYGWV